MLFYCGFDRVSLRGVTRAFWAKTAFAGVLTRLESERAIELLDHLLAVATVES